MKTSRRHGALPEDLEVRLADYERQANAHVGTRAPREDDVANFAPAAAPVAPDLAAPGFVSFTGGASRQSVNAGAPRDVSPAQAAFYAELDEDIATLEVERP